MDIYIVGDLFKRFAKFEFIYNYSQAFDMFSSKQKIMHNRKKVIFTQGISLHQVKFLKNKLIENGFLSEQIDIPGYFYHREQKEMVHKSYDNNVIITEPVCNNNTFDNFFYVVDEPDIMKDHQTGLHSQGMLLYEAARQTLTSIVERYIHKRFFNTDVMITQSASSMQFHRFVFPFELNIKSDYTIVKQNSREIKGDFCAKLYQFNALACEFKINFNVLPQASLDTIESLLLTNELNRKV